MSDGLRGIERHFQSVSMALLLAVCSWVAFTVQETSVKTAELSVKVNQLETRFDMASANVYTAQDAAKDLEAIRFRLTMIEREIDKLRQD